tara:strand:+ start:2701 stop:3663 length:963 start_codon:yes stop_codon:yes gene_type:complete
MHRYIIFLLLLFVGCVEHSFTFRVHPNGSYNVQYAAHGDKMDLQDHDFSLPRGDGWSIHSTMENVEAESYDFTANRLFTRWEKFPHTFFKGDSIYYESLMKHPISVKYTNWFFFETYTFRATFEGRNVQDKYPLIAELLRHKEDGFPDRWLQEGLAYLLTETLSRSPIEWNTRPIIESSLRNWIQEELQSVNDSTLYDEFDYYKDLGLDVIMQPASPTAYAIMDSIFKSLEDELKITMDLDGDDFDFQLILPGTLVSTNADTVLGDTLFWDFTITDYMNQDYTMEAKSTIPYPNRKKAGKIILLILGVLFLTKQIRKKLA